jgi:hypothetical protein
MEVAMQLKNIGSNMTELSLADNQYVLFSYETPVAGWDKDGPFRTSQFYSVTTSKHINKYFNEFDPPARIVPQYYIHLLVEGQNK